MPTLGKRIAEKRKSRGWTQEALAARLNVTAQAVSKWETGASSPDLSLLPMLARELGTSIDQLMTGENAPPSKTGEAQNLRINVTHEDGETSDIVMPLTLVRQCMADGNTNNISINFGKSDENVEIEMQGIMRLIDAGMTGKIMTLKAGKNTIELTAET